MQGNSENYAERRSTENRSGQKRCNCHSATHEMGGLGFKDVHVTQLIEHVKILLDHGSTATVGGRLLKNVAEATIIERGCRGNIFSADAKNIHGFTTTGCGQQFSIFTYTISINRTTSKNWKNGERTIYFSWMKSVRNNPTNLICLICAGSIMFVYI